MTPTIDLVCSDPAVGARLTLWLERARLVPPVPLTIEVQVGEPRAAGPRTGPTGPVFRQPGVAVRSGCGGSAGARVELSWDVAPAVAELDPTAPRARVTLSPAAVRRLDECAETFLVTVLIFLLRRAGWHHIHAATMIDPGGRGWLLAGNAQAGKSTTAALLAREGWQVGGDDAAFLAPGPEPDRVSAVAYRAPIALRPDGYRLLGSAGGTALARRRKHGYWPEELGGRFAPRIVPEVILFSTVGSGATTATPVGKAECLAQLVRWSAWVLLEPALAQEHLDLIARLARQARSYRVTLGPDLFRRPARLAELVA